MAKLLVWTDRDVTEFVIRELAGADDPLGEANRQLDQRLDRITGERQAIADSRPLHEPVDDRTRRLAEYDGQNWQSLHNDLQKVKEAGTDYVTKWYEKSHEWERTPRLMDEFKRWKEEFDTAHEYTVRRASAVLESMRTSARALEPAPPYQQVPQQQRAADITSMSPPVPAPANSLQPSEPQQTIHPTSHGGPSRPATPTEQSASRLRGR